MNKITIIGSGSVGSTIAYTLTIKALATEIVMIDINKKKAMGEALDIYQGTAFSSPCNIIAGDYEDAKDSDIVIITSGMARKPGQSRLDLAQVNVDIFKSIIPNITKYAPNAIYVIVSNPVDILTYTLCKCSDIPESHIIGSGTMLDTARLRARLAEYYSINQNNVHAYVLGEHGDSSFVPWSLANISNIHVNDIEKSILSHSNEFPKLDYDEVEEYVRKSGAKVIESKGATFYAVAISVCRICEQLLHGRDVTMAISSMMHGEYGIDDVCLSTLNLVGREGIKSKVMLPLTDEEVKKLQYSADCLKNIIKQIKI
ncbi:MAG: L-lactate dehydrogenase [Clostridia bacterium]|nr:L-lactate dehydrogenase [Clostridia bacterium]